MKTRYFNKRAFLNLLPIVSLINASKLEYFVSYSNSSYIEPFESIYESNIEEEFSTSKTANFEFSKISDSEGLQSYSIVESKSDVSFSIEYSNDLASILTSSSPVETYESNLEEQNTKTEYFHDNSSSYEDNMHLIYQEDSSSNANSMTFETSQTSSFSEYETNDFISSILSVASSEVLSSSHNIENSSASDSTTITTMTTQYSKIVTIFDGDDSLITLTSVYPTTITSTICDICNEDDIKSSVYNSIDKTSDLFSNLDSRNQSETELELTTVGITSTRSNGEIYTTNSIAQVSTTTITSDSTLIVYTTWCPLSSKSMTSSKTVTTSDATNGSTSSIDSISTEVDMTEPLSSSEILSTEVNIIDSSSSSDLVITSSASTESQKSTYSVTHGTTTNIYTLSTVTTKIGSIETVYTTWCPLTSGNTPTYTSTTTGSSRDTSSHVFSSLTTKSPEAELFEYTTSVLKMSSTVTIPSSISTDNSSNKPSASSSILTTITTTTNGMVTVYTTWCPFTEESSSFTTFTTKEKKTSTSTSSKRVESSNAISEPKDSTIVKYSLITITSSIEQCSNEICTNSLSLSTSTSTITESSRAGVVSSVSSSQIVPKISTTITASSKISRKTPSQSKLTSTIHKTVTCTKSECLASTTSEEKSVVSSTHSIISTGIPSTTQWTLSTVTTSVSGMKIVYTTYCSLTESKRTKHSRTTPSTTPTTTSTSSSTLSTSTITSTTFATTSSSTSITPETTSSTISTASTTSKTTSTTPSTTSTIISTTSTSATQYTSSTVTETVSGRITTYTTYCPLTDKPSKSTTSSTTTKSSQLLTSTYPTPSFESPNTTSTTTIIVQSSNVSSTTLGCVGHECQETLVASTSEKTVYSSTTPTTSTVTTTTTNSIPNILQVEQTSNSEKIHSTVSGISQFEGKASTLNVGNIILTFLSLIMLI